MLRRKELVSFVLLWIAAASVGAAAAQGPPRGILGLRLGMTEQAARSHLRGIAEVQGQEGGKQEIWKLRGDSRFRALIARMQG